jgi:hypothetical protein
MDGAYRGNAIGFKFSRERRGGALPEGIGHGALVMRAGRVRRRLRAADDHHQELVRADERDRRPRGHSRTDETVARPWVTFAQASREWLRQSSHRASAGTRTLRWAESSITIELA